MMKRIIFLLITFCSVVAGFSQNIKATTITADYLFGNERLYIPYKDTTWVPSRSGAITMRPADGVLYQYNAAAVGPKWLPVIGGGGGGGAVSSVFGRIGAVTALNTDYSSFYPLLSGTYNNPTWINQLAWSKITGAPSFLLTGDTAAMLTPYLRANVAAASYVPLTRTINGLDLSINRTFTTSDIGEGSNLYFTNARSRSAISLTTTGTGAATYNSGTGVLNVPTPSASTPNADSTAARIRRGTFAQRPANPDTGQIYYQTDRLAGQWIYDGAMWQFHGEPLKYSHYEQFANGALTSLPKISGLVSGTGAGGSIAEAVGIGSYGTLSTGTTTTGYASYGFSTSQSTTLVLDSMIQYQENRVMIPVLGNATDNFNVAVGWLGHQSTWTFSSAIFWYNYASGGGVWQTFTRKYDNSGNMTYKVSTVTVEAGRWYKLGILADGYAQKIEFYIDDVLVTTHSTAGGDNIPIPNSTVSATYNFGITKTAGTNARLIYVDYSLLYYIKKKYQ